MYKIEELKKIKKMFDDGLLSEEEYSLLKSEIITYSLNSFPNIDKNQLNKKENDSQSENNIKQEKIIAAEELPVAKPHFSKMGVIFFTAIITVLVLVYQLYDNGLNNFKNQSEISDDNIKNLTDLETYLNREADNYCESWHKAIAFNNEQKKHEEWVRLDGMILNFETQIIPLIVKNNDLPDEYVKKGADFFNKRLSSCGYYYYGGSPPDTNLNESNKIDESQAIEPVIINDENDSIQNFEDLNASNNENIEIGKDYEGGTIIYFDNTKKHGIICSPVIITDRVNSLEISKQKSRDYFNNGGNWRLPSKSDFKLIANQKSIIDLKDETFWTSNEDSKFGLVYESIGNSFVISSKEWQSSALIYVKNF